MTTTQLIKAGRLIDGSGVAVRRDVFLAVQDTVIVAMGPAADLPRTDPEAIDDFSHCTILPGLVDCSVVLSRSPALDMRVRQASEDSGPAELEAMLARHIRYCHAYGVLGVADSHENVDPPEQTIAKMARESLVEIRTSGHPCRSLDDCHATIQGDCDYLKIAYSSSIEDNDPSPARLSPEELRRMLQLKGGKKAVVIANGRQRVREALAAGCDAIEQGYDMGKDNLRQMAENNVLWIPGLLRAKNGLDSAGSGGEVCCRFSHRYVAPGKPLPGAAAFWQKTFDQQLSLLNLAREMGVSTAVGTGAGSIGLLHGESMVEEMKLFIKAGYSLEETIHCASENGARFFDMDGLGRLAVGRKATFLISRGTVQQLPRKLSYLEGIYINGRPSPTYHKNPVRA